MLTSLSTSVSEASELEEFGRFDGTIFNFLKLKLSTLLHWFLLHSCCCCCWEGGIWTKFVDKGRDSGWLERCWKNEKRKMNIVWYHYFWRQDLCQELKSYWNVTHSLGRPEEGFCRIFLLLPWSKCSACKPEAVGWGIVIWAFNPRREKNECCFNKIYIL